MSSTTATGRRLPLQITKLSTVASIFAFERGTGNSPCGFCRCNGQGIARRTMHEEPNGFFSFRVPEAADGSLYYFQLDDDPKQYPDPASRFQPHGVHGPSQVIDPGQFEWSDGAWPGLRLKGQVIYEMHVGTFTPQGTWAAAAEKLTHLVDLGITLIEVMPVAEFQGEFGWGYDGAYRFAHSESTADRTTFARSWIRLTAANRGDPRRRL